MGLFDKISAKRKADKDYLNYDKTENVEIAEAIEKEIEEIISKSYDKKSEFFPEYNEPPSRIA